MLRGPDPITFCAGLGNRPASWRQNILLTGNDEFLFEITAEDFLGDELEALHCIFNDLIILYMDHKSVFRFGE